MSMGATFDPDYVPTHPIAAALELFARMPVTIGQEPTSDAACRSSPTPVGFPSGPAPSSPAASTTSPAARAHCLGALYAAASAGLPTLTDKG